MAFVNKYRSTIENKKSGAISWTEKMKVWKKIEEEFEAETGNKRDAKTLRDKYANLKKTHKK